MYRTIIKPFCIIFSFSCLFLSCESDKERLEHTLLDRKVWVVDSIKIDSSIVFSFGRKYTDNWNFNENIIRFHKTGIINLPPMDNNLLNKAHWELIDSNNKVELSIEKSDIKNFNQVYFIDLKQDKGLYHLKLISDKCSIFARAPYVH